MKSLTIGKTLFVYVGWQYFRTIIAILLLLLSIITLVEFVENLRRYGDIEEAGGTIFLLSFLKAPYYIDRAFPFSALFSAMLTLGNLNNKLELVVARAAGISAWQFLLPITIVSLFVGALSTTIYNPVALTAFQASEDIRAELAGKKGQKNKKRNSSNDDFWMRQKDETGSTVINAQIARKNGRELTNVRFIRFDEKGTVHQRLEAKSASFSNNRWILTDGTIIRAGHSDEAFKRHEIKTNISGNTLLSVAAKPDSVGFWQLPEIAQKVRNSGLNHLPYLVQFHALLALPLFMVAMVVIAATVSLKFVRFGQAGRLILGGILSGFVLYAGTQLVNSLGGNGIVSPFIAAWSPPLVAILFGMNVLLHQEDG